MLSNRQQDVDGSAVNEVRLAEAGLQPSGQRIKPLGGDPGGDDGEFVAAQPGHGVSDRTAALSRWAMVSSALSPAS
jgi:hypothetical protein